jgi:hypothetical protein
MELNEMDSASYRSYVDKVGIHAVVGTMLLFVFFMVVALTKFQWNWVVAVIVFAYVLHSAVHLIWRQRLGKDRYHLWTWGRTTRPFSLAGEVEATYFVLLLIGTLPGACAVLIWDGITSDS